MAFTSDAQPQVSSQILPRVSSVVVNAAASLIKHRHRAPSSRTPKEEQGQTGKGGVGGKGGGKGQAT